MWFPKLSAQRATGSQTPSQTVPKAPPGKYSSIAEWGKHSVLSWYKTCTRPRHYGNANRHSALPAPSSPRPKGQLFPDRGEGKGQPNSRSKLRGKPVTPSSLPSPRCIYQLWLLWDLARRGVLPLPSARKMCRGQLFKYSKLTHLSWSGRGSAELLRAAPGAGVQEPAGSQADPQVHRQPPAAGSNTSVQPRGWPQESQSVAELQCSSGVSVSSDISCWCWPTLCSGLLEDGGQSRCATTHALPGRPCSSGGNSSKVPPKRGKWIKWFLRI